MTLLSLPAAYAEPISFTKEDRILIIAPHPDDEALGAGGVIQSALGAGASVRVVYLTHGDHNEIAAFFYQKKPLVLKADFIKSGKIREAEAVKAMSILGVEKKDIVFLGYPDFGTMRIWKKHWGDSRPFTSFPTGINRVPYEDDFSYGSPYLGESVVADFEKIILLYRPTYVFATPPFDLNADHRAVYLYFNLALLNLRPQFMPPKIYLYPVHVPRWPASRKYAPSRSLEPPVYIRNTKDLSWTAFSLTQDQILKKKEAISQYKSQMAYSRNFLLSFARKNEIFLTLPYEKIRADDDTGLPAGRQAPPGERNSFNDAVRDEPVEYKIRGGELWIDARLSNPLEQFGGVGAEVFSYKEGVSFSKMPKLSLSFLAGQIFVRDGRQTLRHSDFAYGVKKNKVWVRVPLALLKEPDLLFVSTHAVSEKLSLDFGSWKILEIEKKP